MPYYINKDTPDRHWDVYACKDKYAQTGVRQGGMIKGRCQKIKVDSNEDCQPGITTENYGENRGKYIPVKD